MKTLNKIMWSAFKIHKEIGNLSQVKSILGYERNKCN
jgi:hypothetical protein